MTAHKLYDRFRDDELPYGLSCDEGGIFLAGEVPLITPSANADGRIVYKARSEQECGQLVTTAYGRSTDFSNQIAGLNRVAQYMTEGKWVVAKIAAVQLRWPDLPDDIALAKLMIAESELLLKRCTRCRRPNEPRARARKRDVSDEPRIPAGQSGGGEWTTEDGTRTPTFNPLLIPAQAITVPIPAPFELPLPPTEVTPFPFEIPGANLGEPVNPYPDRPECVEEWAYAYKFCDERQKRRKLRPGYGGFGKDFARCVLGLVSEACGGNPTGA
jgi:hypothetical protein